MSGDTREVEGWFSCTHWLHSQTAQGDDGFPCSEGSIFHEDLGSHSLFFVLFCFILVWFALFCVLLDLVLINQSIFLAFYQIFIPAQVNWNCSRVVMGLSHEDIKNIETSFKFVQDRESTFLLITSTNRCFLLNIPGSVIWAGVSWISVYTLNIQYVLLKNSRLATRAFLSPSFFFLLRNKTYRNF